MGEIIFSLLIGVSLVGVGLFMNWKLYLEEKKHGTDNNGTYTG